jgi:hypothetical protein
MRSNLWNAFRACKSGRAGQSRRLAQPGAKTMHWNIMARVGLGPIRLGMARERLVSSLGAPLTFQGRSVLGGGPLDFYFGNSVQVHYDRSHAVASCTIWRGGPYLHLGGRCVWSMSRLELGRILAKTWAVAPAHPQAGDWVFDDLFAWFKWEGKRLAAVAICDKGTGMRLRRMARVEKYEPEPKRRRQPELVP